ncbi:DUF4168 domain-containing protein [Thiohalophilus thiocyanatoxydans]|uniref:Uncharacterized protein DUF4168 n=1 Tax=Thiohalophilus thiocyanatoxydans TaxID=381308 RepID=A0A4R8IXT5_9GAMM|nr:DUF4168 domain-containing protein [Thiohalophilus thiocyanatoxydans]TDY02609.1 uncharacterized protein DUF4168 [Thiohalophilus thiocyanatoxydans]
MLINRKSLLVALFGMGLTLGMSANTYAQAQGGAQQQQQQGGQPAAKDIDEASLNKFKDAFAEVNSIRESFAGKLENVEDSKKAQELQQEAQENMVSAVEDAGLSVQEYNQIFAAVQQNPELQEKVLGDQ